MWLEVSRLGDPTSVAATIAHELGHVHLIGGKRVDPNAADHEPLTDLLTVFLGLGVLTSNSTIRDRSYHVGNWDSWSISRQGYLTSPMFG